MAETHKEQAAGGAAAQDGYVNDSMMFSTATALQQLRMLVSNHPWFRETEWQRWFELPYETMSRIQAEYHMQWSRLGWQMLMNQPFEFEDARFRGDLWSTPAYGRLAALYLLNAQYLQKLVDQLPVHNAKDRQRLQFLVEQIVSAASPSNLPATNPDVLQRAAQTQGESLRQGALQLLEDLRDGKLRQCALGDFRVGVDLATTEGSVVFENEVFQLIQYKPLTAKQYRTPLLVVPPFINKFYILDLRQKNSLVRYLLEQGHQVFLMSWRNCGPEQATLEWDDYMRDGVMRAIGAVRDISGEKKVSCMGFCVGGTLLASTLAVMAAKGEKDIASMTLLTTMLDFSDTGILDVFIDESFTRMCEKTLGGSEGTPPQVMSGNILANTFSLLRPDSLWWNYTVDKYLKGEKPRPMDLLYWNNDSTNLPGVLFCWYLRHAYLQNDLRGGKLECCGTRLDFSKLTMPCYIYASKSDHIVPWTSAFASLGLSGSRNKRFVLGASGHIAGVINPPADNKRNYWLNDLQTANPKEWLASAESHPGSWWPNWDAWLKSHAGAQKAAATKAGNSTYKVIEAAPGRYVAE